MPGRHGIPNQVWIDPDPEVDVRYTPNKIWI